MNISYINILQTIESFASAHLQIKKFASDFPAQMPNFATKNEEYPILFVSPTNSIFQENSNRYEIDVYCFDIIQSDRENINTILSDTNLILNDLNRWMLDGELFGIDNVSTSEATPIDNSLLDYAAGWVMRMTFETDTYGICEIPFSDSPVVITEVNNIVYSKYLTCETLSECPTIIDINNTLSGLTGTAISRTSQLINDGEDGTNPFVDTIDLATKFNNPTGTTNEYILGNGSLAPISGITSLVKNITPDSYLGLRLTPTDAANNGFYINKSINGAVGYYARNTDNSGNGAVAALTVGGIGGLYDNYASFFHANDGYFVPYLRGKNGINTNNDFFFVGWNGSSFDFRTGTGSYGSETSKFKISSGGTLTIGIQPSLDNTITDILGRKSDGSIVRVDKSSLTGDYVPYTGATKNVDLGEYELKAGQLTLDITPTGTTAVGTTRWNDTIGSSETMLKGGSVILKNGVDLVARIVNKVTPNATLTKAAYPVVRISGAQGQRLAVAYAQANNDNNSADTLGVVIETIATNQEGFIMTVGQLEGINTTGSLQGETWNDGDVLYLSPTTAGKLTNVKPSAPGHIVVIGYVEYAHINNGKIYVKIINGWELDELHNVSISAATNNQILAYESSTSLWKNKSLTQVSNIRRHSFTNFDGSNSYSYNGYAPFGSSESANVWTITRLTINAFGSVIKGVATNTSWTNRVSATYV